MAVGQKIISKLFQDKNCGEGTWNAFVFQVIRLPSLSCGLGGCRNECTHTDLAGEDKSELVIRSSMQIMQPFSSFSHKEIVHAITAAKVCLVMSISVENCLSYTYFSEYILYMICIMYIDSK